MKRALRDTPLRVREHGGAAVGSDDPVTAAVAPWFGAAPWAAVSLWAAAAPWFGGVP
jgi:hypothetical protein